MAKQVIIAALEEILGEYILNVDKEQVKVQALRGKIKLENVQLDGDLIGGHVLGAVGLQGLGVLSCYAKSLKATIPLTNLEKEPTRFEMRGLHLVCLPLLPSTAHKKYGAGTALDPRCSLRTRSKRSKLARFEKMYMQGNIPGEGPPARRVLRAVQEVEKEFEKRKKALKGSKMESSNEAPSLLEELVSDMSGTEATSATDSGETTREQSSKEFQIPELPKDWKAKLREKAFRNMENIASDVHIRCEVAEGGLDFCHPEFRLNLTRRAKPDSDDDLKADQRAFSFGVTADKLSYRTANEKWQAGSHEKTPETSVKTHLGPNPYDARNNKLIDVENFSFYWDDDPPFLLSETPIMADPTKRLPPDKLMSRITAAMEALYHDQEPGPKLREQFLKPLIACKQSPVKSPRPHQYCFQNSKYTMRSKSSDRMHPGPVSSLIQIMPFHLDLTFRPHQFIQYQKMKSAMLSQQRFDTMLRQRPTVSPRSDARAWWKYAIGCVITRPNSRSWQDVVLITSSRKRYIELIIKKMSRRSNEGSGFHAGLSDSESTELLALEELLPMEALSAFHLIALRIYIKAGSPNSNEEKKTKRIVPKSPMRGKGVGRSITRMFRGSKTDSSTSKTLKKTSQPLSSDLEDASVRWEEIQTETTTESLVEIFKERLSRKVSYTNYKVFQGGINLTLLSAKDKPIVMIDLETIGTIQTFGSGRLDAFFDVTKFEIVDQQKNAQQTPIDNIKILVVQANEEFETDQSDDDMTLADLLECPSGIDKESFFGFMDLPPSGTVCRLAAAKDLDSLKFSFSAHPATLVWTRPCFDALAEFFGAPTTELQTEFTNNLRIAATPLARKAQLALLSPSILDVHINMAAPKLWVPMSARGKDGAVFLDAGHFKMACTKNDGESSVKWDINANDIQVNFAKFHQARARSSTFSTSHFSALASAAMGSTSAIIRPFHVNVVVGVKDVLQPILLADANKTEYTGSVNFVSVIVSPICLNLVDAEVLARAFGKWYAQGVLRVRSRITSRVMPKTAAENESDTKVTVVDRHDTKPDYISITVEKVELALEGHSKWSTYSDEKSAASNETSLLDFAVPTRTYVVEIFRISIKRSKFNDSTATILDVTDASIVQLKNAKEYCPMKARHEAKELQFRILQRARGKNNVRRRSMSPQRRRADMGMTGTPRQNEILRAKLFHDGRNHLDEVEVDVDSLVLRVTPTSLKDCAKGIRKIAELVQLMTREMERKVHEQGRKARRKGRDSIDVDDSQSVGRPVSPAFSLMSDVMDIHRTPDSTKLPSDSSLLLKVTLRESTILAGRPTGIKGKSTRASTPIRRQTGVGGRKQTVSFAVVQVLSNALIMFQSIENDDSSGAKTLHVSLDNLSASVDTTFEQAQFSHPTPMIGPTGAEFRIVYATENLGCVVSQDISVDCEDLKACMTPNDISVLFNVVRTMASRLRPSSSSPTEVFQGKEKNQGGLLSSVIRYKKSGAGVATSIRIEVQTLSFVMLQAFRSKYGTPQFLSFNLRESKLQLEGCMSALSGECAVELSIDFFNSDVRDWEYAVEPFQINVSVDQMPNELILDMSAPGPLLVNLTGAFLRDFAEMDFDLLRKQSKDDFVQSEALTSALSTVGLRRATESHNISIQNHTGFDIIVDMPDMPKTSSEGSVRFDSIGLGLIKKGRSASLDTMFDFVDFESIVKSSMTLRLRLASSTTHEVGEREPIIGLPISSAADSSTTLYVLEPAFETDGEWPKSRGSGRASPETVTTTRTDPSRSDFAYYHAEPVVEWCMQNQRLRSSTVDLFSLGKGRDLLSSTMWSPEEEYNAETIDLSLFRRHYAAVDSFSEDDNGNRPVISPSRKSKYAPHRSNWLRPYLKNDSPEWTDMTCILKMARERVMLPDNNWMWANDWSVDLSGEIGESTDSDGWEYEADFETFTRNRRFYERGDACRRRRWTRTRIVKPPRLNDPLRMLKVVWETSRDKNGNFSIEVKSHVSVQNNTASPLSFFVTSPSWYTEHHIGTADVGEKIYVPLALASAVFLRLAKSKASQASSSLEDCFVTDRLMILPTSYNSKVCLRSSMLLDDVSETSLNFLVRLVSDKGIVAIIVEPVLKVINLLPCQLECQLGEVLRPADKRTEDSRPSISKDGKTKITNVETMTISSGQIGKCTAVNPASKPHISLRVPGYRWSGWQRIVNRKAESGTWRPQQNEEDWHLNWTQEDADYADELKTMVRFDRNGSEKPGDSLILIISIECGHSPTVRIYSQYWIVDKTGFGCRFCESFSNLIGAAQDIEYSRRSHIIPRDARDTSIQKDMDMPGHQWSIGMNGMTMYFSLRETIAMTVETETSNVNNRKQDIRARWVSPMDISNVMPKTVFSVDEIGGHRRFELAMSVTVCPGLFARTRLITIIPRYQVINLLKRELAVSQDCCVGSELLIPSQSSVPFHWERSSFPPKVRLGVPSLDEKNSKVYDECWTHGCIQLDKIGITSMRFPTTSILPMKPMVVQAEVRLAAKDQASAVIIVIWSANEESNPLYLLRNRTPFTILCRQPLQDEPLADLTGRDDGVLLEGCTGGSSSQNLQKKNGFECGSEFQPIIRSFLGLDRIEEFVWILRSGDVACFGFDDPEKHHILEWTVVHGEQIEFDEDIKTAFLEVDAMGSSTSIPVAGSKDIRCQIRAEHSTKVIEFSASPFSQSGKNLVGKLLKEKSLARRTMLESNDDTSVRGDDDDQVALSLRMSIPSISLSVIDNANKSLHGREILLARFDQLLASFSQSREGYHEIEFRLMALQVDNYVPESIHPVLVFCPPVNEKEPVFHLSAVRRLQEHSTTYVFRYVAIRLLEVNVFLDRRTAETVARFIEPIRKAREDKSHDNFAWVESLTQSMRGNFSKPDRREPNDIEMLIHTANSGRMYLEQLHLHPVRLALTFTQEWSEYNQGTESLMVFQFIRGMASIADAPLTFTSFMVGHVFESPQTLARVITTHYSSQLTKQIFAIVGSLAILGAPADFISNVGTGVRDFFYEPINGAVHGPRQFIEGLEAGTSSLARGVFVGVVRGAANVTEAVNTNLAGLTADNDFIDERKAHQRRLMDAMSRGVTSRTFSESLFLAGASVSRGLKSGALGVVEQPTRYASKHGPVGFVKGVGKAIVGAVVKPVVGVGDAAALLMNHVSDATSNKQRFPKVPKRMRRALPSRSAEKPNCVILLPYDDRAAKAQKIVTGGESLDDVYIGHVNIPSHLVILSDQCLWAIDRHSRDPWCVSWDEISHFGRIDGGIQVVVFGQNGLKPYVFLVEDPSDSTALFELLAMQANKMGNSTSNLVELRHSRGVDIELDAIPGIRTKQGRHVFGSCNHTRVRLNTNIKDEIDLIEQCFGRVKKLSSDSPSFFRIMDQESWSLVSCWGQVFSGLSSRRCIAVGVINGTGNAIQIKSTKLVEGGSPCYSIPSREFDSLQGVLHSGGAMVFFGWGVVPSLLQPGNVFMHIETNAFLADLSDKKNRDTTAQAMPAYQVGFLEKSYDDAGWWAKYWLLIRKA